MILALGAFFGLFAVGFGAYSEHGLRPVVSEEQFRFLMTAVRYNQIHAVVIVVIGFSLMGNSRLAASKALKFSGILFTIGTFLFSFSIYASVFFGLPSLTYITPVGGSTLMAAWLLLMVSAVTSLNNNAVRVSTD